MDMTHTPTMLKNLLQARVMRLRRRFMSRKFTEGRPWITWMTWILTMTTFMLWREPMPDAAIIQIYNSGTSA